MKKSALTSIIAMSAAISFADADSDAIAAGEARHYEAGQSVTNIRAYAFAECRRLETFRADFAVTLGRNALMGCTSLREVALPSVTNIAYAAAFNGCVRLENVYLPLVGIDDARASGFPWQTIAKGVVFHLKDGDYDRTGRRVD